MDPLPKLQASIDQARPIIAVVVKGDYDLPTPCTDWNVRQLINHMLGDLVMYRDVGIKGEADPGLFARNQIGDNARGQLRHYA